MWYHFANEFKNNPLKKTSAFAFRWALSYVSDQNVNLVVQSVCIYVCCMCVCMCVCVKSVCLISPSLPKSCKGVIGRVAELLSHGNKSVRTPAVRTIGDFANVYATIRIPPSHKLPFNPQHAQTGNITTGNDTETQLVLNVGALPVLVSLLQDEVQLSFQIYACNAHKNHLLLS